MVNSTVTHAKTKLMWQVSFLHEAHPSLPVLRNSGYNFCTTGGAIFNSKITNKKHRIKASSVILHKSHKEPWFKVWKLDKEAEGQSVWLQLGTCTLRFKLLYSRACPQMTTNVQYWLEAMNKLVSSWSHKYWVHEWWGSAVSVGHHLGSVDPSVY